VSLQSVQFVAAALPTNNQSSIVLAAVNVAVASVIIAPKAGNISNVYIRISTVTTSQTVRASIQGLTTGLPNGSIAQSGNFTPSVGWNQATLGAVQAVTRGQVIPIVFDWPGTAGSVTIVTDSSYQNTIYGATSTGSWAKATRALCAIVGYDDGTYATVQAAPFLTATDYGTGTNPNEAGILLNVPVAASIAGVRMSGRMSGSATFTLYDSSNNVLAAVGVDSNQVSSTSDAITDMYFASDVNISANTDYRITMMPNSVTAVRRQEFGHPTSAARSAAPFGPYAQKTTRNGTISVSGGVATQTSAGKLDKRQHLDGRPHPDLRAVSGRRGRRDHLRRDAQYRDGGPHGQRRLLSHEAIPIPALCGARCYHGRARGGSYRVACTDSGGRPALAVRSPISRPRAGGRRLRLSSASRLDKWHRDTERPRFDVKRQQGTFEWSSFNPQPFASPTFADKWTPQPNQPLFRQENRFWFTPPAWTQASFREQVSADRWHPEIQRPPSGVKRQQWAFPVDTQARISPPAPGPTALVSNWFVNTETPPRDRVRTGHLQIGFTWTWADIAVVIVAGPPIQLQPINAAPRSLQGAANGSPRILRTIQ
jgi:hypothetical protein